MTTSTVDDSNSSDTSSGSGSAGFNNIGRIIPLHMSISHKLPHVILSGLTSKSIRDNSVTVGGTGPGQVNIKRSNTSAAQLSSISGNLSLGKTETVTNTGTRRSHNTGYFSFRDYSPVYGTATLGRGARAYGYVKY